MTHWKRCLGIVATAAGVAHAQPQLPNELSGRYTVVGTTATQLFSLQDIVQDGDKAFKAKLTWWTVNPRCLIKDEPIVGRITATGIAFDAKTKCDLPFTAELDRTEKHWVGRGSTTAGPQLALELKAN